ncbi:Sphingolipid long chain base-responsive protein LSP1 [Penicillium canariense]|uniref:Sphingolipid long chain base-responsive protein LSP1 n=1 Tax=Penicillium canariense TaxID=189055 RepID=A0A9W9HXL4_9EURO|nr:Sphingolipid long chain base-responsive protein LSP1 [Penicillium canariense]KAJ5160808.1 Sphingolipid long chain base-responsive protein LSP1 [Penicillium canariense]
MSTFRGLQQPELSRKLSRLIKNENSAISAHESAGRERAAIAAALSEWGESTEDDAVSDISDKLGVMLAEMGEQEDIFAQNLEDYRGVLKHIRNMEASVQPSRDQRQKVTDEIAKLKYKDPTSTRLTTLEHELVRAEAQNLVAEAQLSNTTRTKLKEAFDLHTAAVIERAEKQIILARHARRLLNFIDDSPVVPGDTRKAYEHEMDARQVLEDTEADLRAWEPSVEPIPSSSVEAPTRVNHHAQVAEEEHDEESVTHATSGVTVGNAVPSSSKQVEEAVA